MKKRNIIFFVIVVYALSVAFTAAMGLIVDGAVTAFSEYQEDSGRITVVIDAGHGGEDGGAVSCTGMLESNLNLAIALRLEKLLNLLGCKTQSIRTTDTAVYTGGNTLAAKKVSDLKHRVAIVSSTKNALLVSIHQNTYPEKSCAGAQVFYAKNPESQRLAESLQGSLIATLNPNSHRKAKKADGIYLMEHISVTGVLVECGFLSNPYEEALLRTPEYQKKLCCIIASAISAQIGNGR